MCVSGAPPEIFNSTSTVFKFNCKYYLCSYCSFSIFLNSIVFISLRRRHLIAFPKTSAKISSSRYTMSYISYISPDMILIEKAIKVLDQRPKKDVSSLSTPTSANKKKKYNLNVPEEEKHQRA